jgi:hypothetical protein
MVMARMMVISLMVGVVAAGFVWFGFDLVQNLRVVIGRVSAKRKQPAAPTPESEEKKPAKGGTGKPAAAPGRPERGRGARK